MSGPASSDRRVDELRQQLKALGYLDAGVDRFVLGPARETRRRSTIAMLASARIGLLGALLLGPSAAIGLGGRLPGLITGPRDAVVVAIYLGLIFGMAVAVVAFVASTIVAAVANQTGAGTSRRARTLAILAGTVVSIACLAYLTLWWQTANAGLGWSAPVWTAFALIVAAAISLLLGHAVTITALALTIAAPGAGALSPRMPGSSWKAQLAGGGLAFAGAAALLVLTAPAEGRAGDAATLAVVSSGTRVRLYAIDGFDWKLFAGISAQGRLPALSGAFGGARAELAAEGTRDPARAWTTIATGQPPDVHGVQGLETRRIAGLQGTVTAEAPSPLGRTLRGATDLVRLTRPAVASGSERRAKTLWEVASGAGLRTAVLNWWATWPAPARAGIVLSDRATLRLETGGPLDAEIAPADLYEPLLRRWPSIKSQAAARAAALDVVADDAVRALLRRSAELDAVQVLVAREVTGAETDLLCVYLPGLDLVQHGLLASPDGGAIPASVLRARLDALHAYYGYLDALLADALIPAERELVVVIAGPGRVEHRAVTAMSIRGSIATAGSPPAAQGRAVDVMPTILHALGVPIARDLAGRALIDLFEDAFVRRYPVREVATYGSPAAITAPREGKPLDQEMIDRLRSLGYVK
jgi:hypothetical protein